MNLLKYKGKHIRVSDKSLVFRFSAGSLFLLFLAVIMLLNLKSILTTDWKSVSFLQDGNVHLVVTPYRIVTIVVAALVCVLAALFYRRFQYDRVKQLFHRQKLARMLLVIALLGKVQPQQLADVGVVVHHIHGPHL